MPTYCKWEGLLLTLVKAGSTVSVLSVPYFVDPEEDVRRRESRHPIDCDPTQSIIQSIQKYQRGKLFLPYCSRSTWKGGKVEVHALCSQHMIVIAAVGAERTNYRAHKAVGAKQQWTSGNPLGSMSRFYLFSLYSRFLTFSSPFLGLGKR